MCFSFRSLRWARKLSLVLGWAVLEHSWRWASWDHLIFFSVSAGGTGALASFVLGFLGHRGAICFLFRSPGGGVGALSPIFGRVVLGQSCRLTSWGPMLFVSVSAGVRGSPRQFYVRLFWTGASLEIDIVGQSVFCFCRGE